MAKIFLKTVPANELVLINAVREAYYQPFQASNWRDLRLGFLVSVCSAAGDDTITGLTEQIGSAGEHFPFTDRFSIGLTDSQTGTVFAGYTNRPFGQQPTTVNPSKLISSDGAIGTTNTNFWRPVVILQTFPVQPTLQIMDNNVTRAYGQDGSEFHLVQNTAGAGGYATLIAMRFQRDSGNTPTIRMSVKRTGANNGDIAYTNTPTETVLLDALEAFPPVVQTLGPVQLTHPLDTIWCYWPFSQSRLRIHAYGILRVG
jgi:hypothetical protein